MTGMWQGEVFAISDCLVRIVITVIVFAISDCLVRIVITVIVFAISDCLVITSNFV